MLIGNKIFPYPLLNHSKELSGYKKSEFCFKFDLDGRGQLITINDKIILKNIHFTLNNQELMELYRAGKTRVLCVVECSSTVYRKKFEITDISKNVEIPLEALNNGVVISAYMISNCIIKDFKSVDFLDDFQGYTFEFDKYDILAADDGYKFRIEIDETNENKMTSIFNVIRKENAGDVVGYTSGNDKIDIYLSDEYYHKYDTMKNYSKYNKVFFSMLIIPVLSNCLYEIQSEYKEDDELDDICDDKRWFSSVLKRYRHVTGNDMDSDTFKTSNPFELAQLLMGNTTCAALTDYFEITMTENEEENDE